MQLPANAPTNGWYNLLPPPPAARLVSGTVRVAWAIVGAGLTGLAAARQLGVHLPQTPIALLEAERVGFGSSGRNSGFVLDSHFLTASLPFDNLSLARARSRLCSGGRDILKRLVRENQIECSWHDWGKLWVAAGPLGEAGLQAQRLGNEQLEIPYRTLDHDEVAHITGTRFYTAGVKSEGTALVNPAALCRGLATTLPSNVTVYEETPVLRFERGRPFRLVTQAGEVIADQVILCTNVFSPSLGIAKYDMVPVVAYASLTRPMTEHECNEIGGDRRGFGLLPGAGAGSTIQRTPDSRLLMRNTVGYGYADTSDQHALAKARANHYDSIHKRWPALRDIEIDHTWGGCLGITRNEGHLFGSIGDRLWSSIACNGASVARGTMAGTLLADLIVGNDSDLLNDQLSIPRPAWLPPEPIRALFSRRRLRRAFGNSPER